jgi:deazaflavin-dependent oxidoreductase (nitroreductase family)
VTRKQTKATTGHESNPRVDRILTPIAASRPVSWFYVNVAPALDRALLRLTGGRFTTGGRHRVGFLRVKGAKTGRERVTPLVYTRDGDKIVLVASRGGDTRHPAWYRNLIANPEVRFSIEGEERAYRARELEGVERERAWQLAVRRYGGYATYQRRAGERRIPVMVLEPRND